MEQDNQVNPEDPSDEDSFVKPLLESEDLVIAEVPDEEKKSTVMGATLTLINTIIGTSIIGLPVLLERMGLILGMFGIMASCIIGIYTGFMLLRCKNMSREETYNGMAKRAFPKGGDQTVRIVQIFNNLGMCINYIIICGTTAATLVQTYVPNCENSESYYCTKDAMSIAVGLFLLPFSFIKNFRIIEKTSLVKVIAVTIFASITIGYGINAWIQGTLSTDINVLPHLDNPVSAFSTITIATLTCSYQFNMMPIYRGLKRRNDAKMKKAVTWSVLATMTLFCLFTLAAYFSFGPAASDVLVNFTTSNLSPVFFILLNVCFFLNCLFIFPVVFFEVRVVLETTVHDVISEKKKTLRGFVRAIVITIAHGFPVFVAVVATNIDEIFQILGSTTMNCFTYIFPALIYLKLSHGRGSKTTSAVLFLIFGIILLIIGLYGSIFPAPANDELGVSYTY